MTTILLEWHGTKRYSISEDGVVLDTIKGKKKPAFTRNGYKCVRLNDSLKDRNEYVHRLLGKAFIPNPLGLPCINHIDGNKLNNSLDNLEWCTYADNLNHAYSHGLNHKTRKIRCVETGTVYNSIMQCQRETGVNHTSLCEHLKGRNKTCAKMHWEYIK
jgi:hypothetical protein